MLPHNCNACETYVSTKDYFNKNPGRLSKKLILQIPCHHDGVLIHLIIAMAGTCILCLPSFTGSACHFLVRLLYFLAYLNFPSEVFAWGRNTWMLWSIAARVTLAKCTAAFKKPCNCKYWYHTCITECTSLWNTSMFVLH